MVNGNGMQRTWPGTCMPEQTLATVCMWHLVRAASNQILMPKRCIICCSCADDGASEGVLTLAYKTHAPSQAHSFMANTPQHDMLQSMCLCQCQALRLCMGLQLQEDMVSKQHDSDILQLPGCGVTVGEDMHYLWCGPRVRCGLCEGVPTSVVPHTTSGRADYFGTIVNRYENVCKGKDALEDRDSLPPVKDRCIGDQCQMCTLADAMA